MGLLIPAGESALEGDHKVQHQERLPILVRLATTSVGDGARLQRCEIRQYVAVRKRRHAGKNTVVRSSCRAIPTLYLAEVGVRRHFRRAYSMKFLATALAQDLCTSVNRDSAPAVRKTKRCPSVATVCGSEKGKQGLILIDRQQLPITKCPSSRNDRKGHYSHFSNERRTHVSSSQDPGVLYFADPFPVKPRVLEKNTTLQHEGLRIIEKNID